MANKVGSIFVELGLQADKFNRGMKNATKSVFSLGNIATGAAVAGMVKMAASYESAMARVKTITSLSTDEFEKLDNQVKDLSKDMGISAKDSANALYQAISAGVDPNNAVSFLEDASKLAIGSTSDLTGVVDTLTSVINAYGMEISEADKISNTLFLTEKNGKTTVEELSAVLSRVTPIAASLGLEFEQVAASFAALTVAGVPTAEAATQIRSVLAELSKEGTKSSKIFNELAGESFKDFIENGGTVAEAMVKMSKHGEENGIAMADMFGSIEAANAAMLLASDEGAAKFSESLQEMKTDTEATDRAFGIMKETTENELKVAMESLRTTFISIATPLAEIVGTITNFMTETGLLIPVVLGLITVLAALKLVSIGTAIANAAMAVAAIPVVGPALAVAAAASVAAGIGVAIAKSKKMAHGGIVTGETLATIGEDGPEAVIPLTKPNPFMNMLNSGNKSQTINIILDGQLITRNIIDSLDEVVNVDGNKFRSS